MSSNGATLGHIRWYAHWRRYVLEPASARVWDRECLTDVVEFIDARMAERHPNARFLREVGSGHL